MDSVVPINGLMPPLPANVDSNRRLVVSASDTAITIRPGVIGDINFDNTVTIADFITLASNFNKSPANYADGDVNYDGSVSIADFIDLAANFNKTLPAPAAQTPQAPASSSILASADKLPIRRHHHRRRDSSHGSV